MPEQAPPEEDFEELIRYVQESRGMDFRGYKRSSLRRRIALRMDEVGAESFPAYQSFLEVHPQEFPALLNTILINVTSFFRDTAAWDSVRTEIVPRLAAPELGDRPIRLWSVGCASGQEPYSLAMLLAEKLGQAEFCRRVKIYATDLDEHALESARHALYTPREVEEVPPPLLDKYFERSNGHYMFNRELRRSVIFGRHNVVSDAPISRIDLLVCRNLLIYLETEAQNVVLPRLHYALVDDGVLFLGKAETQLARSKLFRPIAMKHRLFAKVRQEWRRTAGGGLGLGNGLPNGGNLALLETITDHSPVSYLAVDAHGLLVYANRPARHMLEVGEADIGRPFQDLAISYRPVELRSRIEEALTDGKPVRLEHQEHRKTAQETVRLSIEVTPLLGADRSPHGVLLAFTDTTRTYLLQQELQTAQESLETTVEELQSTNEELETTNEELQSTNEELETTNEELQSTNEELETTNEELRSTNEELEAANEELRRQSEESAEFRAHADAILGSIDAGVVVLDSELRVRSWNRWSENAWGLRGDEAVGRRLLDLDIGLPVRQLEAAIAGVLQGEAPRSESTLQAYDRRGRAMLCLVRITRLASGNAAPHGLVLIMQDVTEDKQQEEYVSYLGRVIGESLNEVYFLDPTTLHFTLVNRGAEQKLGYGIADLRKMALPDLMPHVSTAAVRALVKPLIDGSEAEIVFETVLRGRAGDEYPAEICLQYLGSEQPPILVAMVHDITERVSLGEPAK
jgi:two-component system CheB/CheR fusion protein